MSERKKQHTTKVDELIAQTFEAQERIQRIEFRSSEAHFSEPPPRTAREILEFSARTFERSIKELERERSEILVHLRDVTGRLSRTRAEAENAREAIRLLGE